MNSQPTERPTLHARLFGSPAFALDAETIAARVPIKTIALLAYLLLHRERAHDRARLAFAFWPDVDEEAARANLRRHLYRITKILLPETATPWLQVTARTVGWNASAPLELDVARFETLADAGELRGALAVYRGELLEPLDEPWILPLREALHDRFLRAARTYVADLPAEASADAIEIARRVLLVDPFDESAVRALMTASERAGDRIGALREYRRFAERTEAEFGVAPAPETVALHDRLATDIAASVEPTAAARRRAEFATPANSFVGRERSIAELGATIERRRIVTLVGIGGIGKTRLAQEAAAALADGFADGVAFVDCGGLADPTLVASFVADSIGRSLSAPVRDATLAAELRDRRSLIVFDNCENALEPIADLVATIARTAPGLRILATSRERLGISDETVVRVPPLDADAAKHLFHERAASVASRPIVENDETGALVARVLERLGGVPLALELAASATSALDLERIDRALANAVDLKPISSRDQRRQDRTMNAALDWSFGALAESDRVAFAALSVFRGGFTLEAAAAVVGTGGVSEESRVSEIVARLVDRSLLDVRASGASYRYAYLEPVRSYASALLDAEGSRRHRRAHAEYYARLSEAFFGAMRPEREARSESTRPEIDNVRAALAWSFQEARDAELGARIALGIHAYWAARPREGVVWAEVALASITDETPVASRAALHLIGAQIMQSARRFVESLGSLEIALAYYRRDGERFHLGEALELAARAEVAARRFEIGERLATEGIRVNEEVGNAHGLAWCRDTLGYAAVMRGDYVTARRILRDLLASDLAEAHGPRVMLAANVAIAEYLCGDADTAIALSEREIARERERGGERILGAALGYLGIYLAERGDLDRAREVAAEGLSLAVAYHRDAWIVDITLAHAAIARRSGAFDRAAKLFGFSETRLRASPNGLGPLEGHEAESLRRCLVSTLPKAAFEAAYAAGAAWSTDVAVAFALASKDDGGDVRLRADGASGDARVARMEKASR